MALRTILSFVVILAFTISCQAFWWGPSSTTETPVQPVKQIPLGYFRTYTYQPVGAPAPYSFSIVGTAANPFTWPTRIPSAPMLPGTRYELYPLPSSTESAKPPTTTTTSTTTTTTSTPPPPPPPAQPPLQLQDRMDTPLSNPASKYADQAGAYSQYQGGIYNRRSLPYYQQQGNFYRPYPYPDYSTPSQRSTIQFVPCMCPITVASQSSLDVNERRTMPDGGEIVILDSAEGGGENTNSADNIVQLEEIVEKKTVK